LISAADSGARRRPGPGMDAGGVGARGDRLRISAQRFSSQEAPVRFRP